MVQSRVAASSGSPLGTPYGDWGWQSSESSATIPKSFGFEAATRDGTPKQCFPKSGLTEPCQNLDAIALQRRGEFGANMWSSCSYMPTRLVSCRWTWYNGTMFVNATGKYVGKGFVAVLVCLSLIGNSVYGTVLCFGADGHIEFESVFHEQCKDHVHSPSTDHDHHSSEPGHEHDKHCHSGQCVDVPISFGLAEISKTPRQLNPAFAALAVGVTAVVEQSDCSEYVPASNAFVASSYFSPLRTVILLA